MIGGKLFGGGCLDDTPLSHAFLHFIPLPLVDTRLHVNGSLRVGLVHEFLFLYMFMLDLLSERFDLHMPLSGYLSVSIFCVTALLVLLFALASVWYLLAKLVLP